MSNGAQEENRRADAEAQQSVLQQINRKLARLIVLMEVSLRCQGFPVPPVDTGPIVRFTNRGDEG